jgi:hypothetical protein
MFVCIVCVEACVALGWAPPTDHASAFLGASYPLESHSTYTSIAPLPDGHPHGHCGDGLERDDGHEDHEAAEGGAEVREPVDDGAQHQGADEVKGQLGEELRRLERMGGVWLEQSKREGRFGWWLAAIDTPSWFGSVRFMAWHGMARHDTQPASVCRTAPTLAR